MATFGRNSTSTTYTTIEAQLTGAVFTLTERATVTSLTADLNVTTAAKNAKLQIYRHSDLALIAQTNQLSVPVGHAQRTFTFTSNPIIDAGDYILTAWSASGSGNGQISYAAGAINQGHYKTATYGTAPNPLVTPTHNSYAYNIYATYTPGYTKLYFASVNIITNPSTVAVQPNFKCPNDGYLWTTPSVTISAPEASTTDYNQKVSTKCSTCQRTIEVFIAMHRDPTIGVSCCIQKSTEEGVGGIPADWWSRWQL